MRRWHYSVLPVVTMALVGFVAGQDFAPPPAMKSDEATLQKIKEKTEELGKAVEELKKKMPDPLVADVEVFHKAAVWIVKHEEWYHKDYPKWTLEALERGLERAVLLGENKWPWLQQPGRVARGYRSKIDGSVQPYGLVLPKDFGKDKDKKWRLDVVLHGRDASLTEVKFLHQNDPSQPAPEQDFIQLNIYGRGNNAYRWAGEQDVMEAIAAFDNVLDVLGNGQVDHERVVLRGFSMGGAGSWHLGLHYPDFWCSVSPGAGFSTTRGYVKKLPEKLPDYQEKCLHIYDAVDYAENAFNVPIVAYGGEKDPQLQAAKNIEAKLKPLGIPMTLLIGPDTEHRYHPDSLQQIMKLQAEHAARGKPKCPPKVRFVTYLPRHDRCFWVSLWAQEKQYERTLIEGESTNNQYRLTTANARLVEIKLPDTYRPGEQVMMEIDGQKLQARGYHVAELRQHIVLLEKQAGRWSQAVAWKVMTDFDRRLQKYGTLTGPIDLAFTEPFLCVRGTGRPWHEATHKYADADLKRFQQEWSKYFRGELPVKNDVDVLKEDFETRHLILFGDPASNSLIAHALDRLPLQWNKDQIGFGGKEYPAASHLPVMIFPSPYQTRKYVVLNSGHTFHAPEFEGTNALLFPRLGDYAILKLTPTDKDPLAVEVVTAGLFDEYWRAPKEKKSD